MSAYAPGTVAMVTMRSRRANGMPKVGAAGVTHLAFWDAYNEQWVSATEGSLSSDDHWHYEVRPLVVLDLEAANDALSRDEIAATAVITLRESPYISDTGLAEQIEAQTKPPRIPEPDLWGVVEASVESRGAQRGRFVRDGDYWEALDWPGTYGWGVLVDPVLVRDGIEDGAS